MRRLALVLTVVGLLGLAANTALADRPSSSSSGHVQATMVKHYGPRGAYSSHYRGHSSSRSRYRGHYGYGSPYVIVRPPAVRPYPGYPPVVRPPVYSRSRYPYYRPRSGVYYRGRGIGFSITF